MFFDGSTIRFDDEKGIGESYFILCPVCWNYGIKITIWENGTKDEEECPLCNREEQTMEVEDLERLLKNKYRGE